MKNIICFLLVILATTGTAGAYTLDNINVNLQNGAYLSFPYVMTYDGTQNQSYGMFQFMLNGSSLTFSTGSNRTVTGVALNSATDEYTFNSNGITGYLNFSATMQSINGNYSFYINNSYIDSKIASNRQVYFNYTVSDTNLKEYKVSLTPIIPEIEIGSCNNLSTISISSVVALALLFLVLGFVLLLKNVQGSDTGEMALNMIETLAGIGFIVAGLATVFIGNYVLYTFMEVMC